MLSGYRLDQETTVVCDPYEHTDFNIEFPANSDLYHSLTYRIANTDYLETMLFLTFKVTKLPCGNGHTRCILSGYTHGSVLFFDLDKLGKYTEQIHPEVGDIVEIDFPDENNREKYEITECYDRQLTPDGVNPLLHKYVWKCKAKRYVNSHEEDAPPDNEADARIDERRKFEDIVQEEVAKEVSFYDTIDEEGKITEDAAYGGYSGVVHQYDKQIPAMHPDTGFDYIEDGTAIDIMRFGVGSRLVTNGFDLIFVTSDGRGHIIAAGEKTKNAGSGCIIENGSKWLKATDKQVVFVNIEGTAYVIGGYDSPSLNIDSLYEHTVMPDDGVNGCYESFIKFGNTRTRLFATQDQLFIVFADNTVQPL